MVGTQSSLKMAAPLCVYRCMLVSIKLGHLETSVKLYPHLRLLKQQKELIFPFFKYIAW